jgi:hypothetical protein
LYDEILFWPRRNVGHAYNWIVTNDSVGGYLFSITDGPPDISRSPNGAIRIMRYTYKIQDNPLWAMWEQDLDVAAPYLINRHLIDVTDDYCDVDTLRIKLNKEYDPNNLVWLCGITSNRINAINFAVPDSEGNIYFQKVTKNLLYVLAKYESGVLMPVTSPFISKGKYAQFFIPKMDSLQNYKFKMSLQINQENRNIKISYWDNGWQQTSAIGKRVEIVNKMIVKKRENFLIELNNVPKGTIFYIKKTNSWFTFDDNGKLVYF